ncbi:MAG: transporter substrate-binding domain-containing protein [Bryobacteraceae bacterium]
MIFLPALGALGLAAGLLLAPAGALRAASSQRTILRVGVAGSEPFVIQKNGSLEGISVEIWQALADQTGWHYRFRTYEDVPDALDALSSGALDVVVGPVSITAARARHVRFSQPYFASSLSIASRSETPSLWERLDPFFSPPLYYALGIFLLVLCVVGTFIWLAERESPDSQFPQPPGRGIASGIYFAIVTMSTVGYGDLAPRTRLGRLLTGIWIVISVIAASSLVAGIASALTITGLKTSVIATAAQLNGRAVAVLKDSPGQGFARDNGARLVPVHSLAGGYNLLVEHKADALVFDRPQLRYFLQQQHNAGLAVSQAEYMRQNYGFAFPLSSNRVRTVNLDLLQLEESGRVDRIVRAWLGDEQQ